MNALESPLEALAFNYVNFGILSVVNNLWAWIAVVTAAVSFWRIRGIGAISVDSDAVKSEIRSVFVTEASPEEYSSNDFEPAVVPSPVQEASVCETCIDGITRGKKFTVHYEDERDDAVEDLTASDDDRETTEEEDCEITAVGEWWGKWESVVRTRNGDEWYRYVDLTAIDGNVVRLWDDGVRRRSRGSLSPGVLGDEWLCKQF